MAKILLLLLAVSAVRADEPINGFFRQMFEKLRPLMPTGIPELGVPPLDPLEIPNMTANVMEKDIDLKFKVGGYRVSGLSKFKFDQVKSSLNDLTLSIDTSFSQLDGDGFYDLKGKYHNLDMDRNGRYFVKMENVVFKVTMILEKTNDILQIKGLKSFQESFGSLEAHLDNKPSERDYRMRQVIAVRLINEIKSQVNKEIGKAFIDLVNKQLAQTPVSEIIGGASPFFPYKAHYSSTANIFMDKLLENVRRLIPQQKLDPLSLPDQRQGFCKKFGLIKIHGEAKIYKGLLRGISKIHRSGNAQIRSTGQGIEISASLGFSRMVGGYTSHIKFMNIGPTFTMSIFVDNVRVHLKAKQNLNPVSKPTLQEFRISSTGAILVKVDGLGILGSLLGLLVSLVTNIIRKVLFEKVENAVGQLIRTELAKISI